MFSLTHGVLPGDGGFRHRRTAAEVEKQQTKPKLRRASPEKTKDKNHENPANNQA
jgi:hypothetical protein